MSRGLERRRWARWWLVALVCTSSCSRDKASRCEEAVGPYYDALARTGIHRLHADPKERYAQLITECRERWPVELLDCMERHTSARQNRARPMSADEQARCLVEIEKVFGTMGLDLPSSAPPR